MVVHTWLLTGERPYVCDVCEKGFCESGKLCKSIDTKQTRRPKLHLTFSVMVVHNDFTPGSTLAKDPVFVMYAEKDFVKAVSYARVLTSSKQGQNCS